MNRAVEGLRVLEETARMLFDDSNLTQKIKNTRHSLTQILNKDQDIGSMMLSARSSASDVLRNKETSSEQKRTNLSSVVRANASRVQEAVRALEEYIKIQYPDLSKKFKKIRFEMYEIEKTLFFMVRKSELVNKDRLGLTVVIDHANTGDLDIRDVTQAVIDGGAGMIVYRDTSASDRSFLENARTMLAACRNREVTALLHERLDIAMILDADGVSIGNSDIPAHECRNLVGESFLIGLSVSCEKDSLYTVDPEADYVSVGQLFISNDEKRDLQMLNEFVSLSSVPALASGEITPEKVESVLSTGVTGIEIKPDFNRLSDIASDLQRYREEIEKSRASV